MSGVRVSHLGPQPLKSNDFRGCFLTSNFIISSKLTELNTFIFDPHHGRLNLVKVLFEIVEGHSDPFKSNIINNLLNKKRPKIKAVVNEVQSAWDKLQDISFISKYVIRAML